MYLRSSSYKVKFSRLCDAHIFDAVNKGAVNFTKFPPINLPARHSNFPTLTKLARAHARKEMSSGCTAVYFLREIVARGVQGGEGGDGGGNDAQERTKRRTRGRSLFGTSRRGDGGAVQDGAHARWFPVFSFSLSPSPGLIPRYRRPTLAILPFFGARYAHGIRNAARVIYARRTHLERAMPDSTFAFAYTRAYVHACVNGRVNTCVSICTRVRARVRASEYTHVTVSGTTERHTATPRSWISISIHSLYDPVGLSRSRSPSLSYPRSICAINVSRKYKPLLPSIPRAPLDIPDCR